MSSASPSGKPKKPPACDFCKAKRVLCHPSSEGCPRCNEKGIRCTTTPVCRRKRRTKAQLAADAAAEAIDVSGSSNRMATARQRSQAPASAGTYLASWTSTTRSTPEAPFAQCWDHVAVSQAESAIPLSPELPLPFPADPGFALASPLSLTLVSSLAPPLALFLDSRKVEAIYKAFASSSVSAYPMVQASKMHDRLRQSGWHVDALPPDLRVVALCALAIGAAFSSDPSVLSGDSVGDTSSEITYGSDLRAFGRRRQDAVRQLMKAAVDAAHLGNTLFDATIEHAASCYMLDVLTQMTDDGNDRRVRPHRPFAKAYASHLCELFGTGDDLHRTDLPANERTWAIHLAVDVCAEIPRDGNIQMTKEEQALLVNLDAHVAADELKEAYRLSTSSTPGALPDTLPLFVLYLQTANRLKQDLFLPRRQPAPIDETAMTSAIRSIAELRGVSEVCRIRFDLFLGTAGLQSFLLPPRQTEWSAESAARALRNLIALTWTTLIPPVHREILRVARVLEQRRTAGGAELDTLQLADRIELLRQQSLQLLEYAVAQQANILDAAPTLAFMIPARLTAVLECAELWIDEAMHGRITLNAHVAEVAASLSRALKTAGWVWAPAKSDLLIASLEAILAVIPTAPLQPLSPDLLSWALTV
ncbi:hypothetical protein JCM10908_002531 [Rhodotorula pacifica]|uniref:uncharacterized protein n=1 Tax=Rhodotorula pacifica TaxID=1495444 RepID=UPI0031729461